MQYTIQNNTLFHLEKLKENKQLLLLLALFLFSPFLTFLYSLYTYRFRNSQFILILFTGLFGFNMIAESESLDLFSCLGLLTYYQQFSFSDIINGFLSSMFNINTNSSFARMLPEKTDIYIGLTAAIISQFTNNGHVLMGFFGLVYGFAFVKAMRKFIEIQPKYTFLSHIPILLAVFMMPISQLAGIRYGTATYLFVWAVIEILNSNKLKYYSLFIIASLIHFSFIIPSLLFILYKVIALQPKINHIRLLYLVYIISFFLPDLIVNFIGNSSILNSLGEGAQNKAAEYSNAELNAEMSANFANGAAWIIQIPYKLRSWYIYSVLFIRILPFKKLNFSELSDKILMWVLILTTFANFSMGVSNLGSRLMMIAGIFIFYYLMRVFYENIDSKLIKNIVFSGLLFLGLFLILEIRFILQYITLVFFYGTSYHIFTDDSTVSVATYLLNYF